MSQDLSKAQQILMWELFAAGGHKLNKDIVPTPEKKDREALRRQSLIRTEQANRSIAIELTDRGWRWIADTEPFPIAPDEKRVTSERRLLQSLMRSIKSYASEHDIKLHKLFVLKDASSVGTERPPRGPNEQEQEDRIVSAADNTIEQQIADAFITIAGDPPIRQVRLRALRERLPHIPRAELDGALIQMRDSHKAKFSTLSNPPDIEAEGDAALAVRDQRFHTIWIEP